MNVIHGAWIRALALVVITTSILGCATTPSTTPSDSAIIQSPNDSRQYRHLELENGLTVLLISDAEADKAAAAMAVFRGSHEDPDERLGLAHFVEHMLFLGTDAYPDVDAYGTYITTHGGNRNAYVAADHANYFFDIQPEYLEGALDRFAPFFISPRFDAQYVEREKHAVHSEYQMQLRNDGWRSFAVSKAIMNPEHPGSRFNIGSLETLDGVTREELQTFFEQHYSAENMALVVLGPQPLETLEQWVQDRFAAIRGQEPAPATELPPAYVPGSLPKLVRYQTLRNAEELQFHFPVPSIDAHYDRQPLEYLSNLIGHEGHGSLHDLLTERGWIESLAAGPRRLDTRNATLSVSIRLTAAGTRHVDEITDALFAYIRLIERHGVDRWRYEEQAAIAALQVRFQEQGSPLGFVYTLAPRFRLYPVQDVVAAPYLMREYDEALIRSYLAELRPDNVVIERSGPDVETDRVEPWFDVPYAVEPVSLAPDQLNAELVAELQLPEPNPFLPEKLAVIDAVDPAPVQLVDEDGLELWVARDGSFDVPRGSTYLRLAIADGVFTPRDTVHAFVLARLVEHELNAEAYPARLAGLNYRVSPHHSGFQITLSGFSDRQHVLAKRIMDVFRTVEIEPMLVARYREELARSWRDFRTERAYVQSHAGVRHLLLSSSWPPDALAERVSEVTAESLAAWRADRLDAYHVTGLLHGNFDTAAAHEMADELRDGLVLSDIPLPEPAVMPLRGLGPLNYGVDISDEDATMVLYLQAADDSLSERAFLGLSAQILRTPYFNDLRTEQQLGYVVMASPTVLHRRGGITFIVQSPVAGAGDLFDITKRFLSDYRAQIEAMPAAEFESHKRGLVSQLLEQDKNLAERSQRFWRDLELGFTRFDSRRQLADLVSGIEQDAYLRFYDGLLERLDNERLVVFSTGRFSESAPTGRLIADPEHFKRQAAPIDTAADWRAESDRSAE